MDEDIVNANAIASFKPAPRSNPSPSLKVTMKVGCYPPSKPGTLGLDPGDNATINCLRNTSPQVRLEGDPK